MKEKENARIITDFLQLQYCAKYVPQFKDKDGFLRVKHACKSRNPSQAVFLMVGASIVVANPQYFLQIAVQNIEFALQQKKTPLAILERYLSVCSCENSFDYVMSQSTHLDWYDVGCMTQLLQAKIPQRLLLSLIHISEPTRPY